MLSIYLKNQSKIESNKRYPARTNDIMRLQDIKRQLSLKPGKYSGHYYNIKMMNSQNS